MFNIIEWKGQQRVPSSPETVADSDFPGIKKPWSNRNQCKTDTSWLVEDQHSFVLLSLLIKSVNNSLITQRYTTFA